MSFSNHTVCMFDSSSESGTDTDDELVLDHGRSGNSVALPDGYAMAEECARNPGPKPLANALRQTLDALEVSKENVYDTHALLLRSVNEAKRLGAKLRKRVFISESEDEDDDTEPSTHKRTKQYRRRTSSIARVSSNWGTLGVHVTFEDAAELCEDVEAAQSMPASALCTLWDSSSDDE